jgi:porphobilinogen deaminase
MYQPNTNIISHLRVATRTSKLALKQVEEVFEQYPHIQHTLVKLDTIGDKNKHISLINNNIPDFFTRELDTAILTEQADIAIHSARRFTSNCII